jgi:hypothetical protein
MGGGGHATVSGVGGWVCKRVTEQAGITLTVSPCCDQPWLNEPCPGGVLWGGGGGAHATVSGADGWVTACKQVTNQVEHQLLLDAGEG